jgi:ABC-2 type transport system permease protein
VAMNVLPSMIATARDSGRGVAVADWNPVSAVAAALRQLFGNPAAPANGSWPLEHPVLASLGWLAVLLAVFVPLRAARYARA